MLHAGAPMFHMQTQQYTTDASTSLKGRGTGSRCYAFGGYELSICFVFPLKAADDTLACASRGPLQQHGIFVREVCCAMLNLKQANCCFVLKDFSCFGPSP
jgi:hypothetical protein